jgi:hypothetical protein
MEKIKEITIESITKEALANIGISDLDLDLKFSFWIKMVKRLFLLIFNIIQSTDQCFKFIYMDLVSIKELTNGDKFITDYVDDDETNDESGKIEVIRNKMLKRNDKLSRKKKDFNKLKFSNSSKNTEIFRRSKSLLSSMDVKLFNRLQPTAKLLFRKRLIGTSNGCDEKKVLDKESKMEKS